jgi:tRNA G46 methylase TrmB
MNDASRPVVSRQTQPHPRLEEAVLKHLREPWRKPVAEHSRRTFDLVANEVSRWSGPVILDTGCGTGMSSGVLARRFPGHLVLGLDKSIDRLGRAPDKPSSNLRLFRAELEDFWILAAEAGLKFDRQCFFYPNPWPKPEQRLRRWPFHPVLPLAFSCGGIWEVRSNWEVYAQEFALAFGILSGHTPTLESWLPEVPETLFEKKYLAAGHRLWRWVGASIGA